MSTPPDNLLRAVSADRPQARDRPWVMDPALAGAVAGFTCHCRGVALVVALRPYGAYRVGQCRLCGTFRYGPAEARPTAPGGRRVCKGPAADGGPCADCRSGGYVDGLT